LDGSIYYDSLETQINNNENLVTDDKNLTTTIDNNTKSSDKDFSTKIDSHTKSSDKDFSTKIDDNIIESYCILSCSRNSENIIHLTQKRDSTNKDEDKSITSVEIKFNEWNVEAKLDNMCLFLLPKNIETILLLSSNLIPSLSSNDISENNNEYISIKNDNIDIQKYSISDDFLDNYQTNKLSKRSSSQSIQINKKSQQTNNVFTFKCKLNRCLIFIINDNNKENLSLPYFDYDTFIDRNFDKSVSFNDTLKPFLSKMLNEYHIKIDANDIFFQINNQSEIYNSSIINFNKGIKNSNNNDLKAEFSMKSISLSEWIQGKILIFKNFFLLKVKIFIKVKIKNY